MGKGKHLITQLYKRCATITPKNLYTSPSKVADEPSAKGLYDSLLTRKTTGVVARLQRSGISLLTLRR